MDARAARRNEVDAWANEGHWVHHFLQFAEPALVALHRDRCAAAGIDPGNGGPRARAAFHLAPEAGAPVLALGERDEAFPELSAPEVVVLGAGDVHRRGALDALADAVAVLDAVHQRCFLDLAVGAVLVDPTPRPRPAEAAWVPVPATRGPVENARLLLLEAVDGLVRQLASVEHAKGRSTETGAHESDWELALVRSVSVASLEYELLRRLLETFPLRPADRERVRDRKQHAQRSLSALTPCLAPLVNGTPPLPLMKDFLGTAYPCVDRSPYYQRPFDREGDTPIRIPPLTPDGELKP